MKKKKKKKKKKHRTWYNSIATQPASVQHARWLCTVAAKLSQSCRKAIAHVSQRYRRAIAELSQSYRKAILMVTRILTPHPTIHAHTWYDMYLCHKSVLRHTPYSLERGLRLHQPVEGLLVHRIRHNLGLGRLHRIASPKG